MIIRKTFTGGKDWISNTLAIGIRDEARLAKRVTRPVIPVLFVHFQDTGDKYSDVVQRVK